MEEPILSEGKSWEVVSIDVESAYTGGGYPVDTTGYYTISVNGDTLVNSLTCKKILIAPKDEQRSSKTAVAYEHIWLLLVTDVADKPDGIMRVEWEVGSQHVGPFLECLPQCHSRHTLAAGIESVKEQYRLFFLHIGLQRYSKYGRKPPIQQLSVFFLTKIAQISHLNSFNSSRGRFISGADFLIDGGCTASYWYGDLQYLQTTH